MSSGYWDSDPRRWGHYEEEDGEVEELVVPKAEHSRTSAPQSQSVEPSEQVDASPDDQVVNKAANALVSLMAQSEGYAGISWAVGAYADPFGRGSLYATSNEGFGFLPWGLRWPTHIQPVFAHTVPPSQRPPWQGLANPARVILDHYETLRGQNPNMRLLAITANAPVGPVVQQYVRAYGARLVESALPQDELLGAVQGAPRLDTVSRELSVLVEKVPDGRRWAAGSSLMMSAVGSIVGQVQPSLLELARRTWTGDVSGDSLDQARVLFRSFTATAQRERVSDSRLGPVLAGASAAERIENDVIPDGGVDGYAMPYMAARACAILERMIAGWVLNWELSTADLGELAYEHYQVVEDVAETAAILQGHGR